MQTPEMGQEVDRSEIESGKSPEAGRRYMIEGTAFEAPRLPAGLYPVATPIGNLGDMTLRALKTLAGADMILCEDTRTSGVLLTHFGISTPRRALHEHNERQQAEAIAERIAGGEAVALISDAGTPLISDPGFVLVRLLRDQGLPVTPIPGASSVVTALSGAGLATDAFTFTGFLPHKAGARETALRDLADRRETLVFFESPHRVAKTLDAMAGVFGGDRQVVVARELTKAHETFHTGTLGELAEGFTDHAVRGEIVILVSGAEVRVANPDEWRDALMVRLNDVPLKQAASEIAVAFSLPKREVYQAGLELKKGKGGG
jgi:16S rRNA (cytidine1402-2'-O)-methyltransferase